MKILKSKKRPALARSRKATSPVSRTLGRKRRAPKAKVRSVQAASRVALTAARPKSAGKRLTDPKRPHDDVPYQTSVRSFEIGVRAFQKQDYQKAAEVFEKLVDIDARDIAERAQIHLRLCRQRTGRTAASPKSAEEHYALGVACMNARHLDQAIEHLSKANKLKPNQDHIHYALAVSHSLGGNADEAITHLEKALALRPENRYHARRDDDFKALANDLRFRSMVYSTGSN